MADQTVTLRIRADADGLVTGVSLAGKETRKLGDEGERAGQRMNSGMSAARWGVQSISTQLEQAKQAAIGFASAFAGIKGVRAIAAMADTWSDLTSRVSLNIDATESAADVMDRLADIARGTYSSLEQTAESFARNAVTLNALGKSTQEQLNYTEALNNALVVSGAKADAAAMVQNSLAKALAEGALRGEELNNVLNRGSRVAELLAAELDTNVTELRALGQQGAITGDVIYATLVNNMQALKDEAASMPATIGDAFTLLRNSVLQTVGVFDQQAQVSETMAEALIVVADNMGAIIKAAVGIGGTLAAAHAAAAAATLAHEAAMRRAARAALAEAEAQLANLKAKGAGIVSTAQLTAAENALAAAQTRAAAAGVAQAGVLAGLGKGLLALAGGPIGLAVAGVAALGYGMNAMHTRLTQGDAAAREIGGTLKEMVRKLDEATESALGLARGMTDVEHATKSTVDKAVAELEKQRAAVQRLREEQERAANIRAGSGVGSATRFGASPLAGLLELEAQASIDAIEKSFDDLTQSLILSVATADDFGRAYEDAFKKLPQNSRWSEELADKLEGLAIMFGRTAQESANAAAKVGDFGKEVNDYLGKVASRIAANDLSTEQLIRYNAALEAGKATTVEAGKAIMDMAEAEIASIRAKEGRAKAEQAAAAAAEKATRALADAASAAQARLDALAKRISDNAKAAHDFRNAMGNLAAQLAGPLAVAQREYQQRMDELQELLFEGTIGLEEAEAAAALYGAQLAKTGDDIAYASDEAQRLESILRRFDDIGMSGLVRDIRLVEEALERGTDAAGKAFSDEQIARMQAALGGLRQEALAYATDALGQGIDSLKSMASEGSKAYAALEVAQTALNLATAIGAIANQGMGDPYTAFARIAAMAAMMSQLVDGIGSLTGGGSGGTSTNSAAYRQEHQGTGTVLGDTAAKSESIARAVEITAAATRELVGINRGMLTALQAMQAGISGASGLLARGAGDVAFGGISGGGDYRLPTGVTFALGGLIGVALDKLFGGLMNRVLSNILGGKESLRDTGIRIVGGALSDMIDDIMVQAYQTIHRSGGWFRSSRDYDRTAAAGDDVSRQFQMVLASMADAVSAAADALGLNMDEINARIASFHVEEIRISTMDLSAEEAQAEIEAVFSKIFDGLAGHVVPFIAQFQGVGEGLAETLIRVATSVQVAQEAVIQLGFALDEADPERIAQISVGLMDLMGGVDGFISGMGAFVDAFAPESHKFAVAQDALTRAFAQFGLEVPTSRDAMWELMQTLDATTESGREQIAMLLRLAGVADSYYQALERDGEIAARAAAEARAAYDDFIGQFRPDDALPTGADAGSVAEAQAQADAWAQAMIDQANALAIAAGLAGAAEEDLALIHQRAAEYAATAAARLRAAYDDFIGQFRPDDALPTGADAGSVAEAQAQADAWAQAMIDQANALAIAAGLAGAAEEDLALIHQRAAEYVAQAAERIDAAYARGAAAYADLIAGILRETQHLSAYQSSMRDADAWRTDAIAKANEHARAAGMAGASEQALALIELRAAQLRGIALAQLREETQSLVDQLYGPGLSDALTAGIGAAGDAAGDYWAAQRRSAETLQNYLDSMLLGDLSALTPEQQLAEAWEQLNAAVTAGDADQATRLADVYLRMLRGMEASGDDYNQGFWSVRELLEGMLADIGEPPESESGGGGGGYITADGAEQIAARNRLELAAQLAQHLADLAGAVGQTVWELMDSMGVDLRQLTADLGISLQDITAETVLALVNMAGLLGTNLLDLTSELGLQLTDLGGGIRELAENTGINLDALTVQSTQALGALANQLGIDLADIAASVGVDLGSLADAQSLLNQALAGEINRLPAEQGDALRPYLAAIENATSEADANAAIEALSGHVNTLAPDIRNALAPYFADVFPADALTDLDYLTQIAADGAAQLAAAQAANALLARIADNAAAANVGAGVPSYAVGTWRVPQTGPAILHAGEMVLPVPLARVLRDGMPAQGQAGGDNREVVSELRRLGERLDRIERATSSGAQDVARTIVKTGEISDRNADASRSRHAQAQRRGVTA